MTVKEYIENRDSKTYRKNIRVLSTTTHANMGHWTTLLDKEVVDVKVTSKYIFIFI